MIYIKCSGGAAILMLFAVFAGRMVDRAYFTTQLRADLNRMEKELRFDAIRPDFLHALENPKLQAYSYFRALPRRSETTP